MSIPISKELRQWPHWKPAACDRQPLPQWSRGCQYLPLTVTKMFEILWKSYSILVNLKVNFQDEDGGISVRPMSSEEVKVPKYIPWSPFHILKVRLSWLFEGPEEKGAPGAPAAGGGGQPEGRLPHLSRALRAWRAGSLLILVKSEWFEDLPAKYPNSLSFV